VNIGFADLAPFEALLDAATADCPAGCTAGFELFRTPVPPVVAEAAD
jgi:hypothetical protein